MTPDRIIFAGPPPSRTELWRRTALAASVFITAQMTVALVWQAEGWPGRAAVLALVTGFGIAFGARFAASGRFRGQVLFQTILGTVSSALFFAIFSSAVK